MDNKNVSGADEMERQLQAMMNYIENDVPLVIGVEAVKHFKNNFQEEGFDGKKWASRKTKRSGSTDGQKILSKSGDLAESIDYKIDGDDVVIYSDLPYAQIHNEGGTINMPAKEKVVAHKVHTRGKHKGKTLFAKNDKNATFGQKATVGAHVIKIPQRQFIGSSKPLLEKITNKIVRDLDRLSNS